MRHSLVAAGVSLALVGLAHAKPPTPRASARAAPTPPSRAWARPAPPLPMLPSVGRVRVEAARDRVVVLEEIHLPRGEWESGGLDLYVAFGAPGPPLALDSRLLPVPAGSHEPRPDDVGDEASVEAAVRRSPGAQPLIGKPQMAGVVVHVKEGQLRRAYETSDVAVLRVRSLLSAPAADAAGARDVVVRLGASGGVPLTLGRIQLVSLEPRPWITRAEATLCGPEADPWPLSIAMGPALADSLDAAAPREPWIVPEMAIRHASDDLCIRWWATP
jgi:hypothetical protein